jgi:hypothetical protein
MLYSWAGPLCVCFKLEKLNEVLAQFTVSVRELLGRQVKSLISDRVETSPVQSSSFS